MLTDMQSYEHRQMLDDEIELRKTLEGQLKWEDNIYKRAILFVEIEESKDKANQLLKLIY